MIGTTDIDHHEVFVLHRLFLMPLAIAFAASSGSTQTAKPSVAQPLTRAVFIATMDYEYRKLDTNRDQKVTLVEFRILTPANFDRIDTDRDGVLTTAEQRAQPIPR